MPGGECTIGINGCHAVQEIQKEDVRQNTILKEHSKKFDVIFGSLKEINKLMLKQAFIIGGVIALIEIVFKYIP